MLAIINGRCVEDPRSKASDLDSKSLLKLDIASNRDIIGIALANMIVSYERYSIMHLHIYDYKMSLSSFSPLFASNLTSNLINRGFTGNEHQG